MDLPVASIAANRAHLYLWTPSAFLAEGLKVVKRWGFRYVTTLVWVKTSKKTGRPIFGFGHYVRCAHEIVLMGERGGQTGLVHNVPSVIMSPRHGHSRKPEELQTATEQLSPGPRLELFARRPKDGWTVWGLEALPGA